MYRTEHRVAVLMFTAPAGRDAHAAGPLPNMRSSSTGVRDMPWRKGPQERASGFDILRDRLPRPIAARLVRAGLMAAGAPAPQPDPLQPCVDEHRDEPLGARPTPSTR
jgi:hypothetical protein